MAPRSRNQIVLELALVLGLWKPRLNLIWETGLEGRCLQRPGAGQAAPSRENRTRTRHLSWFVKVFERILFTTVDEAKRQRSRSLNRDFGELEGRAGWD